MLCQRNFTPEQVIKRRHDYSQHETHYDAQDHTQVSELIQLDCNRL